MVPRWLVRLLEWAVPGEDRDEIVGDLEELHRRRLSRVGYGRALLATTLEGGWILARHLLAALSRSFAAERRPISSIELKLALRLVRRQPFMTATSVVALGVGIGLAAGGVSVVRQAMYSELPFENGDRWAVIETYEEESGRRTRLDLERLRLFRAAASSVTYIGGFESQSFNVVLPSGEVERVDGARVTPGTFAHLPYVPIVGRLLTVQDGVVGTEPVAVIRENYWRRRFERSPDVLERSLDIAGTPHRIVGVLPEAAGYPGDGDIWIPLDERTMGAVSDRDPLPGSRQVAILAEGVDAERTGEELDRISARASMPGRGVVAQRHRVTPMARTMTSPEAQVMTAVMVTVLLLVLIVIASNAGNLIVARTSRRASELAMRSALGASRSRLVGQLFAEALVIGVIAAVPGLLVAGAILETYDGLLDEIPFWIELRLDPLAVVVTVGLALVASLVMGVVPGLAATRRDAGDALRRAGGGVGPGIGRAGSAMIVAEVALSVALIGAAATFGQGFRAYVTPTFDLPDERVLTARFRSDLSEGDLVDGGVRTVADSMVAVVAALEEALGELPDVRGVGTASELPRLSPYPVPVEVEGAAEFVPTPVVYQTPGLLTALEVEPVEGRAVHADDLQPGAPPVAVVNQAFAIESFGTTAVLGRRIRLAEGGDGEASPWAEIVGVVPNVMEVAGSGSAAGVYLPFRPRRFFSVAVLVDRAPMSLAGRLRRAAFDVDPDLTVTEVVRLDQVGAENRLALGAMSSALVGIGVVTLLLSLAGVYAIVSLAVTRRTREIGVRVALGAGRGSVLWSILRRSILLVAVGGLLGAAAGMHFSSLRLFVFAVPDPHPLLFAGLVVSMTGVAAAACWIPARRALAIQPVEALRET